jgi:signal transduction histidine kinase
MTRVADLLARVPIRARVAAAFAVVMALLLALASVGLYVALGATLRSSIDDGLRARSDDVAALARDAAAQPPGTRLLARRGETVAQIVTADGRVVDASAGLERRTLLTAGQQARAARAALFAERSPIRPVDADDRTRLYARPVTVGDRRLVVVVGQSLEPVEVAQHRLAKLLLVGGPVLLLLASIAGYGAAAGALRPMERMRRAAATIRTGRSGTRLEVPPAGDEVARLAVTLNEMLDRLDDAFRRERAFVDDASHEMRTPLALVKGELELASRDGVSVEDLRAAVASAAEENDRLVRLAEDLLVLARADDGGRGPRGEDVPLGALVDGVRRRLPDLDGRVALDVGAADGSRVLHGDPARLERVLVNLVRNAVDAGARRVEVQARDGEAGVELHVVDDGPGFPAAFLPRAFERFARADEARRRGGTGLGLAIVRSMAEAHGGTAGAVNRPGGGADVWITLPSPSSGAHPTRA